jgi:hypothetical protein
MQISRWYCRTCRSYTTCPLAGRNGIYLCPRCRWPVRFIGDEEVRPCPVEAAGDR